MIFEAKHCPRDLDPEPQPADWHLNNSLIFALNAAALISHELRRNGHSPKFECHTPS